MFGETVECPGLERFDRADSASDDSGYVLERKVGDFATAAVGIQVTLDNGHVGEVGIGLTGVGATNLRAAAAEDVLRGNEPTDDAIREVAALAAQAAEPQSDHRGSADYKRNVVRVFCERGLRTAISAAQAGGE